MRFQRRIVGLAAVGPTMITRGLGHDPRSTGPGRGVVLTIARDRAEAKPSWSMSRFHAPSPIWRDRRTGEDAAGREAIRRRGGEGAGPGAPAKGGGRGGRHSRTQWPATSRRPLGLDHQPTGSPGGGDERIRIRPPAAI